MHKSEAEKIDSILDEHQQIYRMRIFMKGDHSITSIEIG